MAPCPSKWGPTPSNGLKLQNNPTPGVKPHLTTSGHLQSLNKHGDHIAYTITNNLDELQLKLDNIKANIAYNENLLLSLL